MWNLSLLATYIFGHRVRCLFSEISFGHWLCRLIMYVMLGGKYEKKIKVLACSETF